MAKAGDILWNLPCSVTCHTWSISVAPNMFATRHRRLCLGWTLDYLSPSSPFLVLVSHDSYHAISYNWSGITALSWLYLYISTYMNTVPPTLRGVISPSAALQSLSSWYRCYTAPTKDSLRGLLGFKPRQTLSVKEAARGGNILAVSTRARHCHNHRTQGNEQEKFLAIKRLSRPLLGRVPKCSSWPPRLKWAHGRNRIQTSAFSGC